MRRPITSQLSNLQPRDTRPWGRQLRLLSCLICLSVMLPLSAQVQATASAAAAPTPMPPEAQAAMNKGLVAAKEHEWKIAIQSFQEARKAAPHAPLLFYNLGLAESKIPGRELRAIAWFGAYLAATPNAPNAAAVNDAIVALQIKNQGNLNRLIETAQNAVPQKGFYDAMRFGWVAGLWAENGNMTAALKIVASNEDYWKDMASRSPAQDFESISASERVDKEEDYKAIAEGQAAAGNIAGAQKSADLLSETGIFKMEALEAIAVEQIRGGDVAGAEKTFASALTTADHIQDDETNGVKDYEREQALSALATVQAKVGDIMGAQKTIELVKDDPTIWWKGPAQVAIVTAQRTAGDHTGAQKTIDLMSNGRYRQEAQTEGWVRFPVVTRPPKPVLSDWLKKLDDDGQGYVTFESDTDDEPHADYCALGTYPFLDLPGYLKTLAPFGDPEKIFEALYDTADRIVRAQIVINRMLKQEAER